MRGYALQEHHQANEMTHVYTNKTSKMRTLEFVLSEEKSLRASMPTISHWKDFERQIRLEGLSLMAPKKACQTLFPPHSHLRTHREVEISVRENTISCR